MCRILLSTFFFVCVIQVAGAQSIEQNKRAVLEHAKVLESSVEDMSYSLWKYSEIALREKQSAILLADILEQEGFEVERGVAGMPTAFVATYGSGSPSVGVLAEYDALPGVGNAAVPFRETRDDGVTSGQGCGHNLFGAASVGAAMAIKRAIESENLQGTVKLFGTPAEETVVGKVYMAKAGIFDGMDAVVEWHPSQTTRVRNQKGRAMNNFEVEFFGQAAHSSADPWNGRSALDAVEMMNYGVNMMREHVKPTARIHYVIPDAGQAPNVVPEYARVWYYVRDVDRKSVETYYERILDIARGAAIATRTDHKVYLTTGVHEYNLNRPLQEAMQANLERIGAPVFSDQDQEFAKKLQAFLELEETGYKTGFEPLADAPAPVSGGSTDVAEVSFITPTVGLNVVTAAADVPWHSWATSACHGTDAGVKGAQVATKVMALTGIDILTDVQLREDAKAFFDEQTGGAPYESPIPADQDPRLPADEE